MPRDILSEIVEKKKEAVRAAQRDCPMACIQAKAAAAPNGRSFFSAMTSSQDVRIIAEIKRASPSRGLIRADLNAAEQAAAYADGGAAALSVLTDGPYFQGSLGDLAAARAATTLPVLRKEFIVSAYQIFESRAWRADAILLIVRILSAAQLSEYLAISRELGMDALVEVHTEADLGVATDAGATLIGINNRNLTSFDTDIGRAVNLVARFGAGQIAVAASGIVGRDDIERNLAAGIHNFLIGESLVRADDPAAFLRHLRTGQPMPD
ncbi:MAG: indole-3-glycerol phosphate synthase TrpC [Desulfobacterales bacterium]|nr:indole-3-glycerol phosphate synthase TrpC [Desulfobacterales bacterium]